MDIATFTKAFEFEFVDIGLPDKEIAKIKGYSVRQVGERRREMRKLPSQLKHLRDNEHTVTLRGFEEYLKYRKTDAWKKEMELVTK
ncbi:hypothetical protein BOVMAS19_12490 [Streptococcus uberis]